MISVDAKVKELAKILRKEKVAVNNKPYCLSLIKYLEKNIHHLSKNTIVRLYGRNTLEVAYCEVCSTDGSRLSTPPEDTSLLQLPRVSFTIADVFAANKRH